MQLSNQFNEGLEHGDLARLIAKRITIDEYKSKIGEDEEIIVITFTVDGKNPAEDLVSFLEKAMIGLLMRTLVLEN